MVTSMEFGSGLETVWNAACAADPLPLPFRTYAWNAAYTRSFPDEGSPRIAVVNGVIAPFIEKEGAVHFSGGEEISDYQDIIGPENAKADAWREILVYLPTHGIHTLTLRNVSSSSETFGLFSAMAAAMPGPVKTTIAQEDTTPRMPLPDSWDVYLESLERKSRHELKRKLRKFEREYSGFVFTKVSDGTKGMRILMELMRNDPEKREFLTAGMEAFFRLVPELAGSAFEVAALTRNTEAASAVASFTVGSTLYLYNSGFDETRFPGSGFVLKALSVKNAIETGIHEYNFLQGSERYKYDLGGKDFPVYRINAELS